MYNHFFFKYTYPQYLHNDINNKFILLPTTQDNFDYSVYFMVQQLNYRNESNSSYYYHHILNSFDDDRIKMRKFNIFIKLQRFKFGFSRLSQLCCLRYKKQYNETTLSMEKIHPQHSIRVLENNCVYAFQDIELQKLLISSLNYMEHGLPVILDFKNPYTNVSFSYHNLVYFYFELLKKGLNHSLFSLYFKCNFNSLVFKRKHHTELYIHCLNRKFNNFTPRRLENIMYDMLETYNTKYSDFANIDDSVLKNMFGNYLKYYYYYTQLNLNYRTSYDSLIYNYEKKFRSRLETIYAMNPKFGRKYYKKLINERYVCETESCLFRH